MTILFICHDTGNTKGLLRAADQLLLEDPTLEIKFLIVGEAALKIFSEEKTENPQTKHHSIDQLAENIHQGFE